MPSGNPYDPSADRQRLDQILHEFSGIVRSFCAYGPLVPGSFVVLRRRCGRSPCRCNEGEFHETAVFLDRSSGKRKSYPKSRALVRKLSGPSADWRRSRRLRAHLRRLQKEMVTLCDRLYDHRLEEGGRLMARLTR